MEKESPSSSVVDLESLDLNLSGNENEGAELAIHEPSTSNKSVLPELNQDQKQLATVISQFALEFYKILTGCFLLFFVPQECGQDSACTMGDIVKFESHYYQGALYFNGATFLAFMVLYGAELKREHTLIKYLDVNVSKARDNESVGAELAKLDEKKRDEVTYNRILYNNVGKVCTLMFIANSIVSGMNMYQHQLGSKTTSVFLTNVLFTATKLGNIYGIVTADRNIFYSAYMTRKVQFNDVDPDHNESESEISKSGEEQKQEAEVEEI